MTASAIALRAQTTSGVRFRLATPDDDAGLRQLLRENAMAGDIQLSLEREPNYFAASALDGPESQTIIAIENGRLVCCGSVSARSRYINGKLMRIGYLGGLRLDSRCRNRVSIIRRGYDLFRRLHEEAGPPIYLTSIVADNLPARRLLERGLPGMPTYQIVGELTTLVIRAGGQRKFSRSANPSQKPPSEPASHSLPRYSGGGQGWGSCDISGACQSAPTLTLPRSTEGGEKFDTLPGWADRSVAERRPGEISEFLNKNLSQFQFAPEWSERDLMSSRRCAGLSISDFEVVHGKDGSVIALAALWDQRRIKQTIVRGYSPRLKRIRRFYNFAAPLLGMPRLPAVGETISHAFVSHLATPDDDSVTLEKLIRQLAARARERGIQYVTLGLDSRDPRLPRIRSLFNPRVYISRLYAVFWDDEGAALAGTVDGRLLAPEVAVL